MTTLAGQHWVKRSPPRPRRESSSCPSICARAGAKGITKDREVEHAQVDCSGCDQEVEAMLFRVSPTGNDGTVIAICRGSGQLTDAFQ